MDIQTRNAAIFDAYRNGGHPSDICKTYGIGIKNFYKIIGLFPKELLTGRAVVQRRHGPVPTKTGLSLSSDLHWLGGTLRWIREIVLNIKPRHVYLVTVISPARLRSIEAGVVDPSYLELDKLVKFLGYTLPEFLVISRTRCHNTGACDLEPNVIEQRFSKAHGFSSSTAVLDYLDELQSRQNKSSEIEETVAGNTRPI